MKAFSDRRAPNQFLSRFFKLDRRNIFRGEEVEIDIRRNNRKIAVPAIHGTNLNDKSAFTSKKFKPPKYAEGIPFNSADLVKRTFGVDPYSDAYIDYGIQLRDALIDGAVEINDMLIRSVELQASQVLQTGTLSLKDTSGVTQYTLDFKPKGSHFPTAGVAWDQAGADPLADIGALVAEVRNDGKVDATDLIMGSRALSDFLRNDTVQKLLDNRRIDIGMISFSPANSGAYYAGNIVVDGYRLRIWGYNEVYDDPETDVITNYLGQDKVIVVSEMSRFDMACAKVPGAIVPDDRLSRFLPGRLSSTELGFDVTPNVYTSTNNKQLIMELESRPVCIPTGIDQYGCLTTR
jgi:hypothetical protein